METVTDTVSPWHGTILLPRMLSNQLGHLLEYKMIEQDGKIVDWLGRA